MLNKITLTNFRKHVDATFEFGDGLHVLRGNNEIGKSTVIEAIAYALFGVKAIRSSLEDAVTWNQPVSTLKVVLELTVDSVNYTVSRGKPGAECVYGDQMVTGQTEVTAFMSRLLKVDANSAAKLMLSTQLDIRGALEAGPKATTELIERLAEFSQIDNLIELMQEKLTLGSSATAQAQIDAASARLERTREVVKPDFDALGASIKGSESTVALAKVEADEARVALSLAQEADADVRARVSEFRSLTSRLASATAQLAHETGAQQVLLANPVSAPERADDEIQYMLQKKADLSKVRESAAAHRALSQSLGQVDGVKYFQGTAAQWQEALQRSQEGLDAAREQLRKGDVTFAALQAKLSSGNCGFCGQDFSELPAVKAKNAELQAAIDSVNADLAAAQVEVDVHTKELKHLKEIQTLGRPLLAAAQKYAAYLDIDNNFYPPTLAWKGEAPVLGDAPDYDGMIDAIRGKVRAANEYQRKLDQNSEAVKFATRELEAAKLRLAEIRAPENEADSAEALQLARSELDEAQETLDEARRMLATRVANLNEAQRQWGWAMQETEQAQEALTTARGALNTLDFNNALLKKVRVARPAIADKLWQMLILTVSSYFSDMRGIKSSVSKGSDGFFVDGHPVATLSGSTLDILGLSIRVALVRTFLPASTFLILDEPAAGCDLTRTSAMLGFLQSIEFRQIIVCSHDPLSESVAENVITLGVSDE